MIVDTLDDATKRLIAERDENTCRKDMTSSELYALGKQIEKLEHPKAVERSKAGTPVQDCTGVRTSAKIADAVGMSERNWYKLRGVGDAAAEGDEQAAADLAALDAGNTTLNAVDEKRHGRGHSLPETVGNVRTLPRRKSAAHVIGKSCEQLDGITEVLDGILLGEMEPAEAERLAASLSRSRAVISKTINQLRSIA
jgi:hypothetical protein